MHHHCWAKGCRQDDVRARISAKGCAGRATGWRSPTFGSSPPNWHYAVSRPLYARAATAFLGRMCSGGSSAGGSTSSKLIVPWRMRGRCTTIQASSASCWKGGREKAGATKESGEFRKRRRPWIAPCCARGAKSRTRSRHGDLRVGEGKGRGEETLSSSDPMAGCVPRLCRAEIGCAVIAPLANSSSYVRYVESGGSRLNIPHRRRR